MNDWVQRIKDRMSLVGITREHLAQELGITYGAITHYLTGVRTPPLRQFQRLASILQVDAAWLQYGVSVPNQEISEKKDQIKTNPVPLLAWNQLGTSPSFLQINHQEHVPDYYSESLLYGLRVRDDSMTSMTGNLVSFIQGDTLLIDPNKNLAPGNFVIVFLKNIKEATFKQFVVDNGIKYLKPINPQYPLLPFDEENAHICGIVVGCLRVFK